MEILMKNPPDTPPKYLQAIRAGPMDRSAGTRSAEFPHSWPDWFQHEWYDRTDELQLGIIDGRAGGRGPDDRNPIQVAFQWGDPGAAGLEIRRADPPVCCQGVSPPRWTWAWSARANSARIFGFAEARLIRSCGSVLRL